MRCSFDFFPSFILLSFSFRISATKDPRVWSQGLVSFYEIFQFLERNVPVEALPEKFHRTEAFERDLVHYLGVDWRDDYLMHPAVRNYLNHLLDIQQREPLLLLPYVYHLYMGLLSGGQILSKKRALLRQRDRGEPGEAVTRFDGYDIAALKNEMRSLYDELGEHMNEPTKKLLIEESRMVFHLNNEIIKVCGGSIWSAVRNAIIVVVVMAGLMWLLYIPSKRY